MARGAIRAKAVQAIKPKNQQPSGSPKQRAADKNPQSAKTAQPPPPQSGICIMCGEKCNGIPAQDDSVMLFFRKIRALLKMPLKFTVVHAEHLALAQERRKKFESKSKAYKIAAIIFFFFLLGGSTAMWRFDLKVAFSAVLFSLVIAALPLLSYYPKFEKKD